MRHDKRFFVAAWGGIRQEGCGILTMTAANAGHTTLKDHLMDCCEHSTMCYLYILIRCTLDHPCTHGEGHCKSDSDCERNGYHICGATCIGFLSINIWSCLFCSGPIFDTKHFPNNTDIKYSPSDMCCVRRWNNVYVLLALVYQSPVSRALKVTQI